MSVEYLGRSDGKVTHCHRGYTGADHLRARCIHTTAVEKANRSGVTGKGRCVPGNARSSVFPGTGESEARRLELPAARFLRDLHSCSGQRGGGMRW